jgi:hypothetical protein
MFNRLSQEQDMPSPWEQLSISLVKASQQHQVYQIEKQLLYKQTEPSKNPILRQMQPR